MIESTTRESESVPADNESAPSTGTAEVPVDSAAESDARRRGMPGLSTIISIVGAAAVLGVLAVAVTLALLPADQRTFTGIDDPNYARGLITLIFSGGTMLIAMVLAIYVVSARSPDACERFNRGKEILTILIGVFGTILGFYFGKADSPPPQRQDSSLNVADPYEPTAGPTGRGGRGAVVAPDDAGQ